MGLKIQLADYTEQEFKALIQAIEDAKTEEERGELVDHFNKIVPHPAGSDLLFYPEAGEDDSADGVARTVSDYCRANGLPGFKN
ncbi:Colicin immunity protein / pyocin immunity protein [Pseudomonas asplenii]|uniref:Colicin immunity protein / pyocin immunity protein n=1 Tax=Pseudomonas asplenii TaxID=53407 RepID=A0A1H2A5G3_9PSED|nr:bacteriocin immunity protein [Pseudomonas asplenii]SDT41117.1 Colicin immunity protein / pyocin immunity protein [Pseudomonas asplenii]